MPDVSDVEIALRHAAAGWLYPSGPAGASVTGGVIRVLRGWPNAAAIDRDMAAGSAQVCVLPVAGMARMLPGQPGQLTTAPVVPTLQAAVLPGNVVVVSGTPAAGQLVGVRVGSAAYAYAVLATDTCADIVAALVALINGGGGPITTDAGAALTFNGQPAASSGAATVVAVDNTLLTDLGLPLSTASGAPLMLDGAINPAGLQIASGAVVSARVGVQQFVLRAVQWQAQALRLRIYAPTPAARDIIASALRVGIATQNDDATQRLPVGIAGWAAFGTIPCTLSLLGAMSDDMVQKSDMWAETLTVSVTFPTTTLTLYAPSLFVSNNLNSALSIVS